MYVTYTFGADSIVPMVKERMNTYRNTSIHVLKGGKSLFGSEARDGWSTFTYMTKETRKIVSQKVPGMWAW